MQCACSSLTSTAVRVKSVCSNLCNRTIRRIRRIIRLTVRPEIKDASREEHASVPPLRREHKYKSQGFVRNCSCVRIDSVSSREVRSSSTQTAERARGIVTTSPFGWTVPANPPDTDRTGFFHRPQVSIKHRRQPRSSANTSLLY